MTENKKRWAGAACLAVLFFLPLAAVLAAVSGVQPAIEYSLPKALGVSAYYFFHYISLWQKWWVLLILAGAGLAGIYIGKKKGFLFPAPMLVIGVLLFAQLGSFFLTVWFTGAVVEHDAAENLLKVISLLYAAGIAGYGIGWLSLHTGKADAIALEKGTRNTAILLGGIFILSLIPIWWMGKYTYPQSDDFSYGAKAHQALMAGEGLLGALQGSMEEIYVSYIKWQGTFSSIFLMTMQPAIWGEQYYHIVPLLLTGVLTAATLFFVWVVTVKYLKAKTSAFLAVGFGILLVTMQLIVHQPSAFFWYNGAVHYMAAYAFLLFMIGFLLLAFREEKKKKRNAKLAASGFFAVLVGGGNLPVGLAGGIILAYIVILLFLIKKKTLLPRMFPALLLYVISYGINVLCPGNFRREEHNDGGFRGPVYAVAESFKACLESAFGEWTNIFLLLMLLLLVPVLWHMVRSVTWKFRWPGLVSAASFCLLSAMYTPQIFAMGDWRVGRTINPAYGMYILLLTMNLGYWLGWLSQKGKEFGLDRKSGRWYRSGIAAVGGCAVLVTLMASPETFTTSNCVKSLLNGEAKVYAEAVEENIRRLKDEEVMDVYLVPIPDEPSVFVSSEIERWDVGTRGYYGKNSVQYEE